MTNTLSGFQVLATHGLLQGEGVTPPNISANLTSYYSLSPVNNFNIIYHNANAANVTITNTSALQSLGANTFPHIFGQVPYDFSSALQVGPLFDKVVPRISYWFGNVISSSVFIQVLSSAQVYAQQSADLLNSAASTQWPNGPSSTASGGFSSIGGSDSKAVSSAFQQLGLLMDMSAPLSGFSNAGCFKQILDSGNNSIGNLHLNFFGKNIIDPSSGISYVVNEDLLNMIINNPVGRNEDDSFQVVSLNPLDKILGELANSALVDTGDLDAVVTFLEINGDSASNINQWTDCLNISLMLGIQATQAIRESLNLKSSDILDAYDLIKLVMTSVKGISNLNSISEIGKVMSSISMLPLSNLTLLINPISSSNYANLQMSVGKGSGKNGNPTVADILGLTNLNDALNNTIIGLNSISNTPSWSNISSDTGNIANALVNGITSPVFLSNGNSYSNINDLCSNAVVLINSESLILTNEISNPSLFSDYNGIAETHNNSIQLMPITGIDTYDLVPDNISLSGFPSQLSSLAVQNIETSGLDVLIPLFDNTITGQALNAIVLESKNNQILSQNGLVSSSFDENPNGLLTSPTGTKTIGGGRVS